MAIYYIVTVAIVTIYYIVTVAIVTCHILIITSLLSNLISNSHFSLTPQIHLVLLVVVTLLDLVLVSYFLNCYCYKIISRHN